MPGGPSTSRLNRPVRALLFGLALGLAGTALELSSAGMSLEEDLALRWLFRLRGPLPPPQDVALIAIDRASQRKLGLPRQYRQWPRHRHTQLIERLIAAGPRLLVFDIFFAERHDDDAAFADALQRAGHVLLAQRIETERSHPGGRDGPMLEIETLVDPSAPLTAAATAVAPFVLPAAPQRVSQFWTFKPECGDAPTLPTVAFQLHVLELYPALRELLIAVDPPRFADLPPSLASRPASAGLIETMRRLRGAFRADPRLYAAALAAAQSRGAFSSAERTRLVTLLDLYAAEHSRYLKYYGPPATVEPLSFERVLTMDESAWRYGVGLDQRVSAHIRIGAEGSRRDVSIPIYGLDTAAITAERRERFVRAYAAVTPSPRVALSAEYYYEENVLSWLGSADDRTYRVPLTLSYFNPNGLFASLCGSYVQQSAIPLGSTLLVSTAFWNLDLSIGFRLPKRLGLVVLSIENALDEDIRFREIDPDSPLFVSDRILSLRTTLQF